MTLRQPNPNDPFPPPLRRAVAAAVLFALALIATPALAPAQQCEVDTGALPRSDWGLIWKGTRHIWGYNHRINALGDQADLVCGESDCGGLVLHDGDTGIGPDSAEFNSHFTWVHTGSADFQEELATIEIEGIENQELGGVLLARRPAVPRLLERDVYTVILSGFKLESATFQGEDNEPMKMDDFRIRLGEVSFVGGQIEVPIEWGLRLDCDSPECSLPSSNTPLHYFLTVRYTVIGGDEGEMFVTDDVDQDYRYAWPNCFQPGECLIQEISVHDDAAVRTHNLFGEPVGYAAAIPGLRGFSFDLNQEHHMLETTIRALNFQYDGAGTGTARFDTFFKNWSTFMWSAHPPQSWFAFSKQGSAATRTWVNMVQFREADQQFGIVNSTVATNAGGRKVVPITPRQPRHWATLETSDPILCSSDGSAQAPVLTASAAAGAEAFAWELPVGLRCDPSCDGPSVQVLQDLDPATPEVAGPAEVTVVVSFDDGAVRRSKVTLWAGAPAAPGGFDRTDFCSGISEDVSMVDVLGATDVELTGEGGLEAQASGCLGGTIDPPFVDEFESFRVDITVLNRCGSATGFERVDVYEECPFGL